MATSLDSVVRLLQELCQRPRVGESPRRTPSGHRSRRSGLPMLCLVRPAEIRTALREQLTDRLAGARPRRIPHAVLTPDPGPTGAPSEEQEILLPAGREDVPAIRRLLSDLAAQVKLGDNSGAGHIRFRRFGLATWLMDQSRTERDVDLDPDRWLRRRLREYDLQRLSSRDGAVLDSVPLTGWAGAVARAVVRFSPRVWSSLRRTGRIPVIGGTYRWFLRRQPYLTPRDPGTFLGFAERLTADEVDRQDPDQVVRLLVHAFLEDLRRAYGHRWWPWRLGGPRRMTYLVALLDGISRHNRGYLLLRLVNEVRTETGQFDPLVLVSASEAVPPYARRAADPPEHESARDAYDNWRATFVGNSRAGDPTAWYLPLTVPAADPVGSWQLGFANPPWWSRRWVPVALTLALVALALTPVVVWRDAHCGMGPSTAASRLRTAGPECVGVTDGSYLFTTDPHMAAVEHTIRRQNAEAWRDHLRDPDRPYAQLVFVAALSSTTTPADPLVAEREALEGVAARQRRGLDARGRSDPIIRVLIANGGHNMREGVAVAGIIRAMAARDHSIVGVVGFDQSRQSVIDTIRRLNAVGLPMVADTLSTDDIHRTSRLYFQVAPENRTEARVAATFAPRLAGAHNRRMLLVRGRDRTDTYTRTLVADVEREFRARGFDVRRGDFALRDSLGAGVDACHQPGMVFYAGRAEDFGDFLQGVDQECPDAPPAILASDDVSRYVADARQRRMYQSIPFAYVSFAVGSPACGAHGRSPGDVYRTIKELFPFECVGAHDHQENDPSLDGHALLSYDAALCLTAAIQKVGSARIPISPGAVWRELSDLHLQGESGWIDFGSGARHQVPPDKAIAILRVDAGSVHETPYRCGQLPGIHDAAPAETRPNPLCPKPTP